MESVAKRRRVQLDQDGDEGGEGSTTDVNALNDAIALSGIDLAAEAENMRKVTTRSQLRDTSTMAGRGPQTSFINQTELKQKVTSIAQQRHLKYLKPDTLDLIGIAVQQRLRNLLEDVVLARNHRLASGAGRPPPVYPNLPDSMETEGDSLPAPMWDIEVEDDVSKILKTIARIEREEERSVRRERADRDDREAREAEAAAQAALAAQAAAEAVEANDELDEKEKKKREKKRKRESAAAAAKNLPEDMQKKITDASARQTLFGSQQKYAWLTGAGAGDSGSTTPSTRSGTGRAVTRNAASQYAAADAKEAALLMQEFNPSTDITWQDVIFALENERGAAAGYGAGKQALFKMQALRRR